MDSLITMERQQFGGYEIEYGVLGFTLGSGTQISISSPANIIGLTAETTYDAYVRANCGGGDVSGGSVPTTFTTTQIPPAVTKV